ncbi:MAG: guanylate kinase [Hyphomicrobiaceae bacterium]|nr:guanylate kinase [Hyphomicrobiaceae bacterium]
MPKDAADAAKIEAASGARPSLLRRGILLVLSSPSGAGKTTLVRRLLEAEPDQFFMSVSVTTRKPRPGEVDGRDYRFVDAASFKALREAGDLLEWAEVFGNCYGTERQQVEYAIGQGHDVLFDIDWQGARQLAESMPRDLVRVFILPPSGKSLEQRLRNRNMDSDDVVAGRMAKAAGEISHWPEYDYIIVNEDVDESFRALQAIVAAERLKRERQIGMSDFVRWIEDDL